MNVRFRWVFFVCSGAILTIRIRGSRLDNVITSFEVTSFVTNRGSGLRGLNGVSIRLSLCPATGPLATARKLHLLAHLGGENSLFTV